MSSLTSIDTPPQELFPSQGLLFVDHTIPLTSNELKSNTISIAQKRFNHAQRAQELQEEQEEELAPLPSCHKRVIYQLSYATGTLLSVAADIIHLFEYAPIPYVRFPGSRIQFISSSNWHTANMGPGTTVCRMMTLSSISSHSLLREIRIYGDEDGSLAIVMECPDCHKEAFKHYLCQVGLIKPNAYFPGHYRAEGYRLLTQALEILAAHELPEGAFFFLQQAVESQDWRPLEAH